MIVLLIVAVFSIIGAPISAWFFISRAQDKQLDAEVKLDMYRTFYHNFTRESKEATNILVNELVDRTCNMMQFHHDQQKRDYVKHCIVRELGHLRHLQSTFFDLLGAPQYDDPASYKKE